MNMHKLKLQAAVLIIVVVFSSCSNKRNAVLKNKVNNPGNIGRVWDHGYYVHANGKYRIVKGHYRFVIFKRAHWKRTLQGNCPGEDEVAKRSR